MNEQEVKATVEEAPEQYISISLSDVNIVLEVLGKIANPKLPYNFDDRLYLKSIIKESTILADGLLNGTLKNWKDLRTQTNQLRYIGGGR